MTYEITPEHFGLTKRKRLSYAVVLLVCLVLVLAFSKRINNLWPSSTQVSPSDWTISDITGIVIYFLMYVSYISWWWSAKYYSLDVDDNAARAGMRVVRKGPRSLLKGIQRWIISRTEIGIIRARTSMGAVPRRCRSRAEGLTAVRADQNANFHLACGCCASC